MGRVKEDTPGASLSPLATEGIMRAVFASSFIKAIGNDLVMPLRTALLDTYVLHCGRCASWSPSHPPPLLPLSS